MNRFHPFILALLAATLPALVQAQVPGEKTVDGLIVRIGMAAAKDVSAHSAKHGEREMHARRANESEHLVVSLAEADSGRRVSDAQVTLEVVRTGTDHTRKTLDLMPMPDAPSYGGWFDLRQPGPYRINVEVVRPGSARKTLARFDLNNR